MIQHRRGVNATQYNPGKRSKSLRAKFGADDSNVVVLWAARLVPEKGADLFADAFVALFNNKTLLEHYKNLTNSASLPGPGPGPEAGDGDGAGSDSDESRPDLDLAGLALSTEPARRSEVRQ